MTDIRIDKLGGLPILYDRSVIGHYGVTGVPMHPYMNPDFAKQCDGCFKELFAVLKDKGGLKAKSILCGGVSRAGTGSSFHHKNRAFDFDGLMFENAPNWVSKTFPSRPQIYLAIEAVVRKHFGTVLNYDFNQAHEDHLHFDNGTKIGFKRDAKSHVIFIQNTIYFVYLIKVGRDGVWGPETSNALDAVLGRLGIGGIGSVDNWLKFLDAVARDGLALAKAVD